MSVSGGAIRAKGTLAKRGPPGWLAGEWMTMGDDEEHEQLMEPISESGKLIITP